MYVFNFFFSFPLNIMFFYFEYIWDSEISLYYPYSWACRGFRIPGARENFLSAQSKFLSAQPIFSFLLRNKIYRKLEMNCNEE